MHIVVNVLFSDLKTSGILNMIFAAGCFKFSRLRLDCSCFDHLVLDRSEAQVPSMASPPTLSGIPRSIKPGVYGKSREELDLGSLLNCDDTLVVPDVGGISSPPESPPLKRRRIYTDLW